MVGNTLQPMPVCHVVFMVWVSVYTYIETVTNILALDKIIPDSIRLEC